MPSRAALVALGLLVLLAGCGGAGTTTTTDTTATTTDTAATTTAGTTAAGTTPAATTTLREVDADAEAVKRDVLDAIAAVERYRVAAEIERVQRANGVTRTATVESTGAFDRAARELRVEQTTTGSGRSVAVTSYLVDATLYQRSPAFVRAYSSEWVFLDLDSPRQQWRALDTLTRQRAVLENASVSVLGARAVNGSEAYVLAVDADEDAYNQVLESRLEGATADVSVDVSDVSFRYTVAADSGRLLASRGTVNSTVTNRGQTVELTEHVAVEFYGYGDEVSVELPDAADTAVDLANRTAA